MNLSGKAALVTGGGRGIGRGCALELAKRGADIVLNERTANQDLEQTCEAIKQLGRRCWTAPGDAFQRAGCEQIVEAACEAAGEIDILISNPAFSRRGSFLEYEPELFEQTIQGTLTGGFHMSQLIARRMVARGQGGQIVFISSVQAEMPIGLCTAYGAAKAGLNHMTRSIAVELAPYRIRVNAIEPGWIDTPGERNAFDEQTIQAEGARLPWGRLGREDDIGKAAAFLVSDEADYITGVVLPVDGLFRYRDCLVEKLPPLLGDD